MRPRPFLAGIFLILAMLACNLPSATPIAATETFPAATATLITPSATLIPSGTPPPTNTPPPTLTFTPTIPVVTPKTVAVNCRLGPGTAWIATSALNVGQTAQILGKNSDGSWWFIVDPFSSGNNCWVSTSVTDAAGNLSVIPVVETPKASVTKVTVKVNPNSVSVAGCVGPVSPIKITGTIEVNGPTQVKWSFDTQQGGTIVNDTTNFDAFGTRDVSADYTPLLTAGSYWVRLIVTNPNNIQAEASYKIEC